MSSGKVFITVFKVLLLFERLNSSICLGSISMDTIFIVTLCSQKFIKTMRTNPSSLK